MLLSNKRITKALIRLRGCAGWSAPVLFTNLRRQIFSRRGPNNIILIMENRTKLKQHCPFLTLVMSFLMESLEVT